MIDYKEIILDYIKNNTSRILSLVDRNKFSKTYGCFDREYWHYKSKNFSNGMYKCYVLSLGLLYSTQFNGNYFFKNKYIKELIIGSINYAINNSHKDGSYDEHYLNEHSIAATCFALYNISETILILSINYKKFINQLQKTSDFLIQNEEFFTRSNHIACIVLALYNIYLLTDEKKYKTYSEKFLKRLFQHFSKEEGWFVEYKGFDPGYLTFTLYYLTKYAQKSNSVEVKNRLKEVIIFCSNFVHSDGSYGGFYGSRENQHFLPLGFERIEVQNDIGKKIVNSFLLNLKDRNVELMSDDRFNFLLFNNFLELLNDFSNKRPDKIFEIEKKSIFFKDAGIFIYINDDYHLILSLKKGGVLYVFKKNNLIFRNCGIIGRTNKGIITSTGYSNLKYTPIDNGFKIWGKFKKVRSNQNLNPLSFILLDIYNLTLGRIHFFSKILKKEMIKSLILKEKAVRVNFSIEIKILENIDLAFTIDKKKNIEFQNLYISSYFPHIYVPSSGFFQKNDSIINDLIFEKEMMMLNQEHKVRISITL